MFVRSLETFVPSGRLHIHFGGRPRANGPDLAALLATAPEGTHLYHCGPGGFMDVCEEAARHWPQGTVHGERFAAPDMSAPPPEAGMFEVTLARRGLRVHVSPGQSVLRALEIAGVRVPSGCLAGICGRCRVPVLAGTVEHNDHILDEEERRRCMTVCVSRAAGDGLVLDL